MDSWLDACMHDCMDEWMHGSIYKTYVCFVCLNEGKVKVGKKWKYLKRTTAHELAFLWEK